MNGIFLRRSGKFLLKPGDGGASDAQVAMVQQELEQLGFALAPEALERLQTQSPEQLARCLRELRPALAKMTGAHRQLRPLFPDFPVGVLRVEEVQLYQRAMFHYVTRLQLHAIEPEPSPPLRGGRALRLIGLGTSEEFEAVCTRLAASPTSLSQQDKDDLGWFVGQYREHVLRMLPESIPFKENFAFIAAALLRRAPGARSEAFVRERLATATDALRVAVAFSEGDVSLAEPTRFGRFPRAVRRLLLQALEACGDPTEDMLRWKERWKRLGERLHPGEYRERLPATWNAFLTLREDRPFERFNSAIERDLREGRGDAAAQRLSQRPGELARRLDHLLRSGAGSDEVLRRFQAAAPRVSTPVLLQLHSHLRHRGRAPLRVFFPKGDTARAWGARDRRAPLPPGTAEAGAAICADALRARFAERAQLGRCWIDPALRELRAPLAQRAASRSLRTLTRGSRLALPDARFMRLFLWWKNGRSRTDIDLSAAFFDREFRFLDTISYYNLRGYGGHHSGDVVDAPNGAAEFIDLDLPRLRESGIGFVAVSIHSFTEQPYCDLPECFAGWMAREDIASGEPFEARTVHDRIDLASKQNSCLPFLLDLERAQAVWCDVGIGGHPRWNNAANQLSGISLILRAMEYDASPDLYSLFELHAHARGSPVAERAQADTVFAADGDVDPFDVDRIRAEFL
ncbi:TerD family protein [Lysobacter enzymogenes]|uniref:TerD family protein n=1 Tax=Lysobacter enzymogenes TaxID=69 RepID=UPI001A977A32|nr:TerD family protein [Lysobacter enzymogenes]QQP97371.1 TerD family protein [Lysobacter enzymogenes]